MLGKTARVSDTPHGVQSPEERARSARTLALYDARSSDYADMAAQAPERPMLAAFAARLPPGGTVLDLGCGSGWAASAFRDRGFEVTAIDASTGLAEQAAQRHGIEVRIGRIEDFSADAMFDGIWLNFSLLHTPRRLWPRILQRLCLALRPGGHIHIGIKEGEGDSTDRLGRHYSYAKRAELAALLVDAGLSDVLVEQRPGGKGFDGVECDILLASARRAG